MKRDFLNRKGDDYLCQVFLEKLSDQRNTRTRKTRRREKSDSVNALNEETILFFDSNSLTNFFSAYKLYEELEENRYDEEFQNMHFKLPEAIPSIDFKKVVKCHAVSDVAENRKGLLASSYIPLGNLIIEYKGILLSRQKFENLNPTYKESCPYVVSYDKIDTLQLVIDARACGNDARFIRRSCAPNAELKHITSNGALHIMIISRVNIIKDNEITIPFDYPLETYKGYIECACHIETCIVRKHNEEWKKLNNLENNDSLYHNIQQHNDCIIVSKADTSELQLSESESITYGEDGKQEKLSREDRKLQALMKQFEKLEKRQDTVKKVKEPKTPGSRVSTDENTNPGNGLLPQKPPLAKKISASKRKSMTAKRRTRQSSCSSEPVSPSEHDANSAVSTPTTPLSSSLPQSYFDINNARIRIRRDKEPLTLTLPIQHKVKHDQAMASPTPPGTPLPQVSPSKSIGEPSTFSLSLDTHSLMESTPMKGGIANGLLQIANVPHTPLSTSMCSSFGFATAEEKIGDLTVRCGDEQPTSPVSCLTQVKEEYVPRKYFGSMKKHWIRKHTQPHSTDSNNKINGTTQISVAALVASLSHNRYMQNVASSLTPTPVFKRPQSYVPLKKRHLMRKMAVDSDINLPIVDHRTNIVDNKNDVYTGLESRTVGISEKEVKVENLVKLDNNIMPPSGKTSNNYNASIPNTFNSQVIQDNRLSTKDEENVSLNENIRTHTLVSDNQSDSIETHNQPVFTKETTVVNSAIVNSYTISRTENVNILNTLKRPYDNHENQYSENEPQFKRLCQDSLDIDENSCDIGLKIVITEPSPVDDFNIPINVNSNPSNENINTSMIASVEPKLSTLHDPRSVPTSPRSSVDSITDGEQIVNNLGGDHGSGGKKKLSFKEYLNRKSTQKGSTSVTLNQPPLPTSEEAKYQPPPLPSTSSDTPKVVPITVKQTADLLTPRTLSLRETEISKLPVSTSETVRNSIDTKTSIELAPKSTTLESNKTVARMADDAKISSFERTQSASSVNSVFEPVSPGNDFESASPPEEPGSYRQSIHSEITKNPFSIHNDITKNPFGKKQSQPTTGLLQYLSAQKYPHLATLTNPNNQQNNSFQQQQQPNSNHYRSHSSSEYRAPEATENDDDASSTHSSVSSTSFGSVSDMLHDRSYSNSNHNRSFSRDYGSRDSRDFFNNQSAHSNYGTPHNSYYQQGYNQHMHPPNSRPSNIQRNTGFNNYPPPSSQSSRHRPSQHRGYLPFQ